MQMILESRVDRLENLMAEVIELCRALKLEAAERELKEKAERARKDEEQAQREKEKKAEYLDILNFDAINTSINAKTKGWSLKQEQAAQDEQDARDEQKWQQERDQFKSEIAMRLDTITDYGIQPGLAHLIKQYFNCEPKSFYKSDNTTKGKQSIGSVLLIFYEDKVFMIEGHYTLDEQWIDYILEKRDMLPTFFNECIDRQIIPMIGCIEATDSVIN
ncbi:MAG: hypothetical protein HQL03_14645, partial [Nitrospirae bacterium]|nr:hypothetical protein [Nitrospirota bacterium]